MIIRTIEKRIVGLFLSVCLSGMMGLNDASAATNDAAAVPIKVVPVGVTQAQIDPVDEIVPQSQSLAAVLHGTSYRHLFTEALAPEESRASTGESQFRTLYNGYTHQQRSLPKDRQGSPRALQPEWRKTKMRLFMTWNFRIDRKSSPRILSGLEVVGPDLIPVGD